MFFKSKKNTLKITTRQAGCANEQYPLSYVYGQGYQSFIHYEQRG